MNHTVEQGFRDIKPLPGFSPKLWERYPLFEGMGLFVVLLLLWLLVKRKRIQPTTLIPEPEPMELFKESIRGIPEGEVRRSAEAVSLIFRRYLGKRLGYDALYFTRRENLRSLSVSLSRALPNLPQDEKGRLVSETEDLLRTLESLTFGAATDGARFHTVRDAVTKCVEELDRVLKREEERTRSVVSHAT